MGNQVERKRVAGPLVQLMMSHLHSKRLFYVTKEEIIGKCERIPFSQQHPEQGTISLHKLE